MHGVTVAGSMGLTTWAAFSGSDDLAAVDGDFIMTAEEVQPVLRSLRNSKLHIVALHNHMIGEQPAFYFTHFWGKGSTRELAEGNSNEASTGAEDDELEYTKLYHRKQPTPAQNYDAGGEKDRKAQVEGKQRHLHEQATQHV
jgi:hypothetical protein